MYVDGMRCNVKQAIEYIGSFQKECIISIEEVPESNRIMRVILKRKDASPWIKDTWFWIHGLKPRVRNKILKKFA